jgi:hypothetical protein
VSSTSGTNIALSGNLATALKYYLLRNGLGVPAEAKKAVTSYTEASR